MTAELFFKLLLFSCWTLAYVLIIRRAWLDKVPAMPFPATCLNTAWEGMMLGAHEPWGLGFNTVLVWFLLDCVILVQFFVYGRPHGGTGIRDRVFWPASLAVLAVGIGTPLAIRATFDDPNGLYSAYFQNALMSVLFCTMLLQRDSLSGQSLYIALAKFLGSAVVITYGEPSDTFLIWCYAIWVVFDLAYIALLWMVARRDGIALLRRL